MSFDDLLFPFHEAEKPAAEWRVGTEAEKFGMVLDDGSPIPFDGPQGVARVLDGLAERYGWKPYRERLDGEVIALSRDGASITLEPGAQLELSGAPLRTVHETRAEFDEHLAELTPISEALGIGWLGLGFRPLARQSQLPWVPKLRYGVMRGYLPTRGARAHDMMRRTATVQANIDYASEADAVRKLRLGLATSPIVTAMFANSPFAEGAPNGDLSHRARVWLDVDPDRTGLLPFAWSDDFGYRHYVEWALNAPMFLILRDGMTFHNTGQTFRAFMEEGFEGLRATPDDWQTHLNTLFPEVRLKRTVEVRGADSQSTELTCALPALTKGLFYDETALSAAEALVSGLDHATVAAARPMIARDGLRAELAGREVGEWADSLLSIARRGLQRIAALDEEGRDESVHLEPLSQLLERGQTPAEALLEQIDLEQPLAPQLLRHARL